MNPFLIITVICTHLTTSEIYFNCWRQFISILAIIKLVEVIKLLGMDI